MTRRSDRPRVTFALFAYNQEEYIREAIEGAFSQTYEPLEIILSDDCSSDKTFEIMQEMAEAYEGPHEVQVRQNVENLGLTAHFAALTNLAAGEIMAIAAGDDISLPDRVSRAVAAFEKDPNLTFVECGLDEFSANGPLRSYQASSTCRKYTFEDLMKNPRLGLVGAGRIYKKQALLRFPNMIEDCPTEDSTSILRCLILGDGHYDPEVFVRYRVHDKSVSTTGISAKRLDAIRRQYLCDVETARRADLLETAKLASVELSLNRTMTGRMLRQLRREGHSMFSAVIAESKYIGMRSTVENIFGIIVSKFKNSRLR